MKLKSLVGLFCALLFSGLPLESNSDSNVYPYFVGNPVFEGTVGNHPGNGIIGNAGVVCGNSNHLGSPARVVGYLINSNVYEIPVHTEIFEGITPEKNAGYLTPHNKFGDGATRSHGWTSKHPIAGKSIPLYMIEEADFKGGKYKSGELTTNPHHMNLSVGNNLKFVGYLYPAD